MGDVVDFLVRIGEDASLRHADGDALVTPLASETLDDAILSALAAGDADALRRLTDHEIFYSTQLYPFEEDEEEDDEEEDGEEGEGDGKAKQARRRHGLVSAGVSAA